MWNPNKASRKLKRHRIEETGVGLPLCEPWPTPHGASQATQVAKHSIINRIAVRDGPPAGVLINPRHYLTTGYTDNRGMGAILFLG